MVTGLLLAATVEVSQAHAQVLPGEVLDASTMDTESSKVSQPMVYMSFHEEWITD